jgi:protein-S-isoprenylcysteine O-methyltransferase Ste14
MKMVAIPPAPGRTAIFHKGGKAYDFLAATPLIAWFIFGAVATLRPLPQLGAQLLARPDMTVALTLLSKCAVLLFAIVAITMLILRQPPQGGARGIAPRVAGLLGTYLAVTMVLLPPAKLSPAWMAVASALTLGGMAFACFSIVWLGRSFSLMAEARQLVTSGPYSVIRHPLYVGEEAAIIGMAILFFSPFTLLLLTAQIACQLYRMHCEEDVLASAFPEYHAYKACTARLVPGVY